jgi:hypothetical protein
MMERQPRHPQLEMPLRTRAGLPTTMVKGGTSCTMYVSDQAYYALLLDGEDKPSSP